MFFIALLILLIVSCSEGKKDFETKRERIFSVKTESLKAQYINLKYETVGFIEAERIVRVKPEVSGKVLKIYKDEGEKVKRGELILKIDDEKYKEAYEEALWNLNQVKEDLENAKSIYGRRKRLFSKGLIGKEEFENAKARYEALLSKLKALEKVVEIRKLDIEKTEVKAPISGVIKRKLIEEGEYVNPQTVLFEIASENEKRVVFKVPLEMREYLKPGKDIYVEASGKKFTGKIDFISPYADEGRMITVKARLNSSGNLIHGEYVKVIMDYKRIKSFKVPEEAVQLSDREIFVWVVENGRAKKRRVKVVHHEYGYLYITGQIKEGDRIITEGYMFLYEGARVKEES